MKDFDADRRARLDNAEPDFQIGGHTFLCYPAVPADVLARYEDHLGDPSSVAYLELVDQTILEFVVEDDHEKWRAARDSKTDPISLRDMTDVLKWLIERQADRPTEAPSDSTDGREQTAPSSTDASSSPEATPTA